MYDLQQLEKSYLPVDKLIHNLRKTVIGITQHKHTSRYIRSNILFHNYITLPFIMNPEIRELVKKYISELITNKEEYGYLYFLNAQKMIMKLHVTFNGELVIDPANYANIKKEMNDLTSNFSCPVTDNDFYEITLIEILYFLTILLNPDLNWITVDFVLRGNRAHDYLISFKDRIIEKTWPTMH